MTATNHAVTGVLVASVIKQPALAIPAAFLSHFLIDEIPHWDHRVINQLYTTISYIVDFFIFVILTILFALTLRTSASLVIIASFVSVLPDAMWYSEFRSNNLDKLEREQNKNRWNKIRWFFHKIQWSETPKGFFCRTPLAGRNISSSY